MEYYIHLQNLILFKKCLAEPRSDAERAMLLKLLALEEANAPCFGKGRAPTAHGL